LPDTPTPALSADRPAAPAPVPPPVLPAELLAAQEFWLGLLGGAGHGGGSLSARAWAILAEEAGRHHLQGLSYRRLADSAPGVEVPAHLLERLRAVYLATATRNAILFRQTSQLVKQLQQRDIPVILLKGMHLARFVYPEPGLRSMHDVDLLVPRHRLADAEQLFVAQGFGPLPRPDLASRVAWGHHLAKLEKAGAPVVELHWTIERPTSPFRLDLDGLWQRSRSAVLDGAPVRLLCPEDLLLHLSLHLSYHHRFERAALKGLVDIAAVVAAHGTEMDWEALARRATAWGSAGYLYTSLRLAQRMLSAPIPAPLLESLPHTAADDEILAVAERYIRTIRAELPPVYLELAQSRSPGNWARRLVGAVFLPRARMEELYGLRPGTVLVFPCYALRLAGLIRKRGGLLLGTLFRGRPVEETLQHEQDRARLEQWSPARPG